MSYREPQQGGVWTRAGELVSRKRSFEGERRREGNEEWIRRQVARGPEGVREIAERLTRVELELSLSVRLVAEAAGPTEEEGQ